MIARPPQLRTIDEADLSHSERSNHNTRICQISCDYEHSRELLPQQSLIAAVLFITCEHERNTSSLMEREHISSFTKWEYTCTLSVVICLIAPDTYLGHSWGHIFCHYSLAVGLNAILYPLFQSMSLARQ